MNLVDRILGSDRNLTQPNFERAPRVRLSYSGLSLELSDSPHSACTPSVDTVESLDLYDTDRFGPDHNGDYTVVFYSRSWGLQGRRGRTLGSVRITGSFLHFPKRGECSNSCFRKEFFEGEILRFCHDVWGWQNQGATLGNLGRGKQTYPITPEQLEYRPINGTTWCTFASQYRGNPPRKEFAAPVTDEHILLFDFTLTTVDGVDFYSPTANLKEASFQIIENFMNNVSITLSPEANKAYAAVRADYRKPSP